MQASAYLTDLPLPRPPLPLSIPDTVDYIYNDVVHYSVILDLIVSYHSSNWSNL